MKNQITGILTAASLVTSGSLAIADAFSRKSPLNVEEIISYLR